MIYTSYFDNIEKLPDNIIPISICGKAPDWYKGLQYRKLAPKLKFFNEWLKNKDNTFYIEHFNTEVLNNLNQYEVINDLYNKLDTKSKEIIGVTNCTPWNNNNINIALICYEKPNEFCHRHLVAEWFKQYNIDVKEWTKED